MFFFLGGVCTTLVQQLSWVGSNMKPIPLGELCPSNLYFRKKEYFNTNGLSEYVSNIPVNWWLMRRQSQQLCVYQRPADGGNSAI